jgi:hypothetical protein
LLVLSCFWSLWSIRRQARHIPSAHYLVAYTDMIEVSILGFMVSGAFLGFVYLDVIYQMIGTTVVLKVLLRKELAALFVPVNHEESFGVMAIPEEAATPA